jgi:hypothetical protein
MVITVGDAGGVTLFVIVTLPECAVTFSLKVKTKLELRGTFVVLPGVVSVNVGAAADNGATGTRRAAVSEMVATTMPLIEKVLVTDSP